MGLNPNNTNRSWDSNCRGFLVIGCMTLSTKNISLWRGCTISKVRISSPLSKVESHLLTRKFWCPSAEVRGYRANRISRRHTQLPANLYLLTKVVNQFTNILMRNNVGSATSKEMIFWYTPEISSSGETSSTNISTRFTTSINILLKLMGSTFFFLLRRK